MSHIETVLFYIIPLGVSFGLTLIFSWWIRSIARRLDIVDAPNQARKIHKQPTPLLGGVALFIVLTTLTIVFWQSGWLTSDRIVAGDIWGLLFASLLIVIGGVLDDKYSLPAWQQFLWPLAAVVLVVAFGMRVDFISNPLGGIVALGPIMGIVVAFVWLLGMTYTTKVLDGLDGLVTGIGAIGALIIFIVSLSWNEPYSAVSVLSLTLAGTALGFLVFNFHPASIFLGESGSLLVGFWLGMLSIIAGSKIATTLLIMGIPILDVAWVIVRRVFIERKSVSEGDRKHLHFRLLDLGWSQRRVVIFLYALTLLFGSVALWQDTTGKIVGLVVLVLVMFILGISVVKKSSHRSV
ncbi:MAG: glycosyltransferase family 4 protein [Patescibacteria group bacterium]